MHLSGLVATCAGEFPESTVGGSKDVEVAELINRVKLIFQKTVPVSIPTNSVCVFSHMFIKI